MGRVTSWVSLRKSFLQLFFASSSAALGTLPLQHELSAPQGDPGSNEQAALLQLNSRPLKLQPTSCTFLKCQTQRVRPCRTGAVGEFTRLCRERHLRRQCSVIGRRFATRLFSGLSAESYPVFLSPSRPSCRRPPRSMVRPPPWLPDVLAKVKEEGMQPW